MKLVQSALVLVGYRERSTSSRVQQVSTHTLKGTLHHSALTVLPAQCNVARSLRSFKNESVKLLVIRTFTRRLFGKARDCPQVKASGCDMKIESSQPTLTGCTRSSHCVMAVKICCKWLPSVGVLLWAFG